MLKERTARISRMTSYNLMRGIRQETINWIAELDQLAEPDLYQFALENPVKYHLNSLGVAMARSLQREAMRMWLRKFGGAK